MFATNSESRTNAAVGSARAPAMPNGARRVYAAASLIAIGFALVGFWPSYFGPLLTGAAPRSLPISQGIAPAVHVHAAVFVLWLLLFALQVTLAANGRIALHRRVGRWLVAYGFVVVGAGCWSDIAVLRPEQPIGSERSVRDSTASGMRRQGPQFSSATSEVRQSSVR